MLFTKISRVADPLGRSITPFTIRKTGPSHLGLGVTFKTLQHLGEIIVISAPVSTIASTNLPRHFTVVKTRLERSSGGITKVIAVASPPCTTASIFFLLFRKYLRRGPS